MLPAAEGSAAEAMVVSAQLGWGAVAEVPAMFLVHPSPVSLLQAAVGAVAMVGMVTQGTDKEVRRVVPVVLAARAVTDISIAVPTAVAAVVEGALAFQVGWAVLAEWGIQTRSLQAAMAPQAMREAVLRVSRLVLAPPIPGKVVRQV